MSVEVSRIILLASLGACLDEFENAMERHQYKAGGTILNPVFPCEGLNRDGDTDHRKPRWRRTLRSHSRPDSTSAFRGIGMPLVVFALHKT